MKILSIAVTIMILVVSGCVSNPTDEQIARIQKEKAFSEVEDRIEEYELIKTDTQLKRDILKLQLEIRQLELEAKAPPVIEGEFIPTN